MIAPPLYSPLCLLCTMKGAKEDFGKESDRIVETDSKVFQRHT